VAQVVELLHDTLNSNPSTTKKSDNKSKKEGNNHTVMLQERLGGLIKVSSMWSTWSYYLRDSAFLYIIIDVFQ
jgi:hypothetical protein